MAHKLVIALGGNALQSGKAEPTAEAQLTVVKQTCEHIAEISERWKWSTGRKNPSGIGNCKGCNAGNAV